MRLFYSLLAALLWLVAIPTAAAAAASRTTSYTLKAGTMRFDIVPAAAANQWGIAISRPGHADQAFRQPAPLWAEVIDSNGGIQDLSGAYSAVHPDQGILECGGAIVTAHGTRLRFRDTYRALPECGGMVLSRVVTIADPSPDDAAFNTRYSLAPVAPEPLAVDDVFMPGVWYGQNAHVPPTALASSLTDQYYFVREDRLPLPMVAVRSREGGATLLLAHLSGDPETFVGENGQARITDARMQFGSIGLLNADPARPSPAFLFPGSEGERTYLGGHSVQPGRWAYRSHPVRVGVCHAYTLLIQLSQTPDFPTAVRDTWRSVYARANPTVVPVDLKAVYGAGVDALSAYCQPVDDVPDVPFSVNAQTGVVNDTSSEMGFVGQALPATALLLGDGIKRRNPDEIERADAVLDFWARSGPTPSGLPKTWYDIHPGGGVTWRMDQGYLRILTDGSEGMLRAWSTARAAGVEHSRWLAFCRGFGDYLVRAQSADGSFARRYDFNGGIADAAPEATDQAVPFLIDLSLATGDARYRSAAVRAGQYCWVHDHLAAAYVGGTPDNPNVTDKEGAIEALAAFEALYDATGEKRWLAAAARAADFGETWVYCWSVPIPAGGPEARYPPGRSTVGLSLIATGQSGCDEYMAAAPFLYYRLSLQTGDEHYRDFARLLLFDTKQMMDLNGSLHYAHPGLLTEVLTLAPRRGHGTPNWLPWLTVAILQPMADFRQAFGTFDLGAIERLPIAERQRRAREYGATRGLKQ